MADTPNTIDLAANLTIAWLNNPNVRANNEDATQFLASMHSTLSGFSGDNSVRSPASPTKTPSKREAVGEEDAPAVSVRKSLASQDHIISMIDGKPYRTLKRHLGAHGLTPDKYRERYGLKPDYPMVAPAYAEKRRVLARKIGLGRKAGGRSKGTRKTAYKKPA